MLILSPAWHRDANCRGLDPELFHPHRDGDGSADIAAARRVCRACDVQVECLMYALEANEQMGIWGGTVPRQRRDMRRDLFGTTDDTDDTAADTDLDEQNVA